MDNAKTLNTALNVVPASRGIRPSKRGRWRAASLILIHVAFGLHLLHWYLKGRTLTPVEPSEAMETLGTGLINAGFVLFAILILSTLVFGRFFCGWGCHIVALQDLCTWLLKRIGIRPRPFRSRLLVFAPLIAALYMFVFPSLARLSSGEGFPELKPHFVTDDFWARFPAWFVGSLTFLVCGFLIVYVLGNKGFCTYGCPYGGVFGLADQVAPGKIRVTDACEGCGHCTATCTSNVRVHQEVRDFGMVVDPGCMKCMDCVNVCPKDALYYGFGVPSVSKGKPRKPRRKSPAYDYSWGEEITLGLLFLVSVVTLTALYGSVPLLLAMGLSAISAYVLMVALRSIYISNLRVARFQLRRNGKMTTAGTIYLCGTALWAAFLFQSAFVKVQTHIGTRKLNTAIAILSLPEGRGDPAALRTLREGLEALERSERVSLFPYPNLLARLGSGYSHLGDQETAERYYRRAVEAAPSFAASHYELARYAILRDELEIALVELRAVVQSEPEFPVAHSSLANLLFQLERPQEAVTMLESLIERRPDNLEFPLTLGLLATQLGDGERGASLTRDVIERAPDHATAHFNLSRILAKQDDYEGAVRACHRSVELEPDFAGGYFFCAQIAKELSRHDLRSAYLHRALSLQPLNPDIVEAWADTLGDGEELDEAIRIAERESDRSAKARFRLIRLYRAAGRDADAERLESGDATPGPLGRSR